EMLKQRRMRHFQNDAESRPLSSGTAEGEGLLEARELQESSFDELKQEIRRLGRELFKVNRAAEGNQELFSQSIAEVRRITSVVEQIPAQYEGSMRGAVFEAKAEICRELLLMVDTLEASLAAADDLLRRLESDIPEKGFFIRFSSVRRMRDSLRESVAALRQWREGQHLLAERLRAILHAAGVRPIEAVGRAFDPSLQRAVSTERRADVASGTVIAEELKGYTLAGRILRYTEVVVAKNE
ncbi:MAG: nucleotide exchange factor GrpE, partial [Blastocatellia bacterium]|nr:nucleotide exchange factor GrpE [Blastocatellia bacterium]